MDEKPQDKVHVSKLLWLPLVIVVVVLIVALAAKIFLQSHKKQDTSSIPQQIPVNKSSQKYFEVFPVRFEDFVRPAKMYGLWPYGVRGNNNQSHNEGHPGWDFELKKGSPIYAITDLEIMQIHDGDQSSGGVVPKVIEASANLADGRHHIVYHSVTNIRPEVVERAKIKAGTILADVGYPLSSDSAMIHFGIFGVRDSVGSCPTDFFSPDLLPIIQQIISISKDQNTGKPFASACVGRISRQIYEQNFPDRVQYLEGGEPWE